MENFQSQTFLAPREAPDGTWVMARHNSPKTQYPLIDAVGDTGKSNVLEAKSFKQKDLGVNYSQDVCLESCMS